MEEQKLFLEKRQKLENARETLKTDFVGLDHIIDEIIDNVSAWFLFPEIQKRPKIINLWGMTGVGKTDLARRLAALLGCDQSLYRLDMRDGFASFDFDDLLNVSATEQPIMIFDEFQLARTKGCHGEEISRDDQIFLWDLLDSGLALGCPVNYAVRTILSMHRRLNALVFAGVRGESGYVTVKRDLFKDYFSGDMLNSFETEDGRFRLVSPQVFAEISLMADEEFAGCTLEEVEAAFMELDEAESLDLLERIIKRGSRQRVCDLRHSLIFVVGNLDEVYQMTNDLCADLDADYYHQVSSKISLPDIKNALQKRFRAEQIARLGNIHIIYPALSMEHYQKIILKGLNQLRNDLWHAKNVALAFDASIADLIYREGVFPTQGVRPVISTLNHLIGSNLGHLLAEIATNSLGTNNIHLSYHEQKLHCQYFDEGVLVHKQDLKLHLSLENLRQDYCDSLQASVAVHESGHAIVSTILMKKLPRLLYSVISSSDMGGCVLFEPSNRRVTTFSGLIAHAAMALGGYAAEKIIFGEKHITMGSEGDIQQATGLISVALKTCGSGDSPARFSRTDGEEHCLHQTDQVEDMVKASLKKALKKAEKVLRQEKRLLLQISAFLADQRIMTREQFQALFEKYATDSAKIKACSQAFNYRQHLFSQLEADKQVSLPQKVKMRLIETVNQQSPDELAAAFDTCNASHAD